MARLLGIDYGTVRVGLALSDPESRLAFPKEVVPHDEAFDRITTLVREGHISEIVVGLPLPLAGGESAMTNEARSFASLLSESVRIPVTMWPELLSSREAAHAPGGKKDDASAAAIVLQSYLDEQSRSAHQEATL